MCIKQFINKFSSVYYVFCNNLLIIINHLFVYKSLSLWGVFLQYHRDSAVLVEYKLSIISSLSQSNIKSIPQSKFSSSVR